MADGSALPPAVKTTCPYCGVGCGRRRSAGRRAGASPDGVGDAAHPANLGRLCSKGTALGATVGLEGRLLAPMIGEQAPSAGDEATAHVARRFRDTIARHGPDSVAFYVSGQLLTEDYYAANKLMKGFIGSGNIDTNSRLCMASAVAAHKQAFGADLVPGCYEDLELADLVVFSGHNAAWTHPVLFRRMEAARGARPAAGGHRPAPHRHRRGRRPAPAHRAAERRAPVERPAGRPDRPGRGGPRLYGRPRLRLRGGRWLSWRPSGPVARPRWPPTAACAWPSWPAFYELFAAHLRDGQPVLDGRQPVGPRRRQGPGDHQRPPGDRPDRQAGRAACSRSPASPTPWAGARPAAWPPRCAGPHGLRRPPSATGVQPVLGRADACADKPGLKAVDMFDAMHAGRIKAVWVMATNPAVSLPNAGPVPRGPRPLPAAWWSRTCMARPTPRRFAHVKLPALAWGEKDGTVTNSERRISRQRAAVPAPGEARADWRIIADVAAAMGFGDAFSWPAQAGVFREYARLTAYENDRPPSEPRPA